MPSSTTAPAGAPAAPVNGLQRVWPAPVAVKVPQITLLFWVLKVLTTGGGETASDYLAGRNPVGAVLLGAAGVAVGIALQLRADVYRAGRYWFAVAMVAVFGTMAADAVHVALGLSYVVTTVGYALGTAAVFTAWFLVERTLDVHSITTRRRELFYWAAVAATFALGTAVGDLSAITADLGFAPSAVLYAALIAVPAVAWRLRAAPVAMFWTAYVLTRPLGASIADWLGKPADRTGLGLGDGPVTVVAAVVIVALVAVTARRSRAGG